MSSENFAFGTVTFTNTEVILTANGMGSGIKMVIPKTAWLKIAQGIIADYKKKGASLK